jgi:hypothetical protein
LLCGWCFDDVVRKKKKISVCAEEKKECHSRLQFFFCFFNLDHWNDFFHMPQIWALNWKNWSIRDWRWSELANLAPKSTFSQSTLLLYVVNKFSKLKTNYILQNINNDSVTYFNVYLEVGFLQKMPWKAAGTSLVDKRVQHVRLLLFRGGQDPQDRTSSVKSVGFLLYGSDINGSQVQKDRKIVWKGLWWSVSDVEILPILNWTDPRDGQSIAFLSNRLEIFITSGLLTLAFSDFHVFQVKLFPLFQKILLIYYYPNFINIIFFYKTLTSSSNY